MLAIPQHKLVFLTNTFREKNAGPYFRIALIKRSIQNNKLKTALASTRIFIEEYPKHKFFNQISSLEKKIRNILSKKLLKVGVLLPLSGKNGQEGEKVYRGIQIALSHLLEKRPDLQVEFSVRNIASSENPSMHIQKKTNELSFGSKIKVIDKKAKFFKFSKGWISKNDIKPISYKEKNPFRKIDIFKNIK